eukprot:2120450-Pleurochrysis_carterae.AAC.3
MCVELVAQQERKAKNTPGAVRDSSVCVGGELRHWQPYESTRALWLRFACVMGGGAWKASVRSPTVSVTCNMGLCIVMALRGENKPANRAKASRPSESRRKDIEETGVTSLSVRVPQAKR